MQIPLARGRQLNSTTLYVHIFMFTSRYISLELFRRILYEIFMNLCKFFSIEIIHLTNQLWVIYNVTKNADN